MEDWEDELSTSTAKQPYYPDLHLKSAIREYDRVFFSQWFLDDTIPCPISAKNSALSWSTSSDNNGNQIRIDSELMYGKLFEPILAPKHQFAKSRRQLRDNLKISTGVLEAATDLLFQGFETLVSLNTLKSKISKLDLQPSTIDRYIYRNLWESIRDVMKDKQIKSQYQFSSVDQSICVFQMYANAFYLVIVDGATNWIMDYQQVLMISDNIGSRFMSHLYLDLSYKMGRKDLPSTSYLSKLYTWGDRVLQEYGNEGYDIIKQLESLCVGTYLLHHEPLDKSKRYREALIEQSGTDEGKRAHLLELCTILEEAVIHPNILFEIFGAYRHFGHPTVDEIAGISVLKDNSREDLVLKEECLIKGSGAFNRSFVFSFLQKQRRWPKCSIREGESPSSSFRKLVTERPHIISEYDSNVTLEDWASLEFSQEFEFEDYEDLVTLLSDTSISPYLENWYSIFSGDLLNIRKPTNMKESRRVLIEMIKREQLSCKKIRETIQARDEIPPDWFVVALHAKEREIKIKARLFAMMCIEMRLYFSMTEKNLAEKIFPYIPFQTMTWSDADLTKTLLELTAKGRVSKVSHQGLGEARNVHVIVSLDFNKFNQKWRFESTYRIFRTFDELLGTPGLYTFSHEFFQEAFFYLSSTYRPPTYLTAQMKEELGKYSSKNRDIFFESETTWVGQKGGCEGLRQKGWTAIIGSMLAANEFETGMSSWIIGQGDNQVIVVAIPSPEMNKTEEEIFELYPQYISDMITAYLDNLEALTKGIGMDLKLEESWVSTSLLNYGKEIIFSGSYASSSMKKISRAYQEISELYPTLQNRVASLFTSAQASCMKGFDILVPYLISLIETLSLLDKEAEYGTTLGSKFREILRAHKSDLDESIKLCTLFLPNECGGLPILPFPCFFYRGHPDPIMLHMIWLKHLSSTFVVAKRIFDLIVLGHFHDKRADPVHLIQDPKSVNFKRPIMSFNKLKDALTDSLRTHTKNKMIKDLLRHCNEKTLRAQAEYLVEAEPCFPRVLNEILRLSPDGSMLGFLATFTNMRTMKGLLPPEISHELVHTLQRGDIALLENLIVMKKITMNEEYKRVYQKNLPCGMEDYLSHWRRCISETVQELRDSSWGRPILGVTTPHPVEQSTIGVSQGETCTYPGCSGNEFILYVVQTGEQQGIGEVKEEYFKRGTVKHYLGSGTSEKRSGPILNYPKNEKALRAAQQLLRVKNWIVSQDPANTLTTFLDNLIQSRTNASENFLILTSGVNYGGSVQHRFSDVTSKHECRPTIRVNTHSRVSICSDELGRYARGQENYPILFQAHFLFALNKIHHLISYYPEVLEQGNLSIHQHLTCNGCLPVLVENPLLSNGKPPKVPHLKNCPLIFASIEEGLTRIPISVLENIEKLVPVKGDPKLLQRSACIASLILEGSIHAGVTPVIHSGIKQYRTDGTLVCLTIGFFMKIGMHRLFTWLARIWVLDNLPAIISMAQGLGCTISDASEAILIGYPDSVWDLIKPYLCVREIQEELRRKLDLRTTSSETFLTGKGIGYAISQYLIELIKTFPLENCSQEERLKVFKLPILSNAPGISLSRAMFIWVNSIIMTSSWKTIKDISNLIKMAREETDKTSTVESVDLSALVISIANIQGKGISLVHAAGECRPILSKVGAEPWIAPSILPDRKQISFTVCHAPRRNITSTMDREDILSLAYSIGYHMELPISQCNDIEQVVPLPDSIIYSPRETHCRTDHQFRLVGQFSTAALKYLTIFAREGIQNIGASVHLAEGSGGVSRSAVKVLGSQVIVYNSLFQVEGIMGHRTYRYCPAELQDLQDVSIIGPEICYQTGGDINTARTQQMLRSEMKIHRRNIGLATCDAEFPSNGTISQAKNLIISFFLIIKGCKKGTPCIFKTFCRFPEILKHQTSIFKEHCAEVKIVVPRFSSHESTEVFLIGKFKGHTKVMIPKVISAVDDQIIDQISETRRRSNPFQVDVNIEILRDFWTKLDKIGIEYNIMNAIQIFLNHSISQITIEQGILRATSLVIDTSYKAIIARLGSKSKMTRSEGISTYQRLRIKAMKKDKKELQILAETILNANILRDIILLGEVKETYWTDIYDIKYKKESVYEISVSIPDWIDRYSRSFQKIIGYSKFVTYNPVVIPNFLRGHQGQSEGNYVFF